jgi:hypothetical protein
MKREGTGSVALAVTILLVALLSPAEGFSRGLYPSLELTVIADAQTNKLVCTASPFLLPAKVGVIVVRFALPPDSNLTSAVLNTASGPLALEVPATPFLPRTYETAIDCKKAKCSTSGAFVLVVEGAVETGTVTCPQTSLFKPSACDECASPARSKAASR